MKIILEQAIIICREIEEKLKPIGYHCALTGSILCRGESEKDIDIIVYPHQVSTQLPVKQIVEHIGATLYNYRTQGQTTVSKITPSTTDKLVFITDYKGIRIDLFFLV